MLSGFGLIASTSAVLKRGSQCLNHRGKLQGESFIRSEPFTVL